MPIVLPAQQDPYHFNELGKLIGTYIGQRNTQNRQAKANTFLTDALNQVPKQDEQGNYDVPESAIQRILMAAKANNIRPEDLQSFLGMSPGQALLQEQSTQNRKSPVKVQISPYEKVLQEREAKKTGDLLDLAEKHQSIGGVLSNLEQLSPNINALSSMSKWTKSKQAADFDATALNVIEPYVELLARNGILSNTKFNAVKQAVVPYSTDTSEVRRGKLEAAKRLHEQFTPIFEALAKAQEQYGASIPREVMGEIRRLGERASEFAIGSSLLDKDQNNNKENVFNKNKTKEKTYKNSPPVGSTLNGYRYKGGSPDQESSWEKI